VTHGDPPKKKLRRAVRMHGLKWGMTRVLGATLMTLLVAGAVSLEGQHVWQEWDQHNHPPPGVRVDVGGYHLHVNCIGTGETTVVLEGGAGEWSIHWMPVMARLAAHTRVCAYDRGGYGWSDPGPRPRSAMRLAEELSMALHELREDGPLVLVAHAEGFAIASHFARRHPDRVTSLVLVDAIPPPLAPLREQAGKRLLARLEYSLPWAHFGTGHLTGPPARLTRPPQADTWRRQTAYPGFYETYVAEFTRLLERTATPDLSPALPRVVVFSQTPETRDPAPEMTAAVYNEVWNTRQRDYVYGMPERAFAVPGGSHLPLEQPDAVVRAVVMALGDGA